eukprot:CAMPEP_0113933922 /NCGR_PEP_ID=MMETSP1339-20121228/1274_1 /TAXON_ID=94617 /ORGANISM="Fibrocapsa japonica" /LENGTH=390 /DNA_ID=CAMNT_0000935491 /DNA_START=103 /DNA_END=1275 /DNA_ORIENTATION=- /assembly_acc=CAM_ASM_000762
MAGLLCILPFSHQFVHQGTSVGRVTKRALNTQRAALQMMAVDPSFVHITHSHSPEVIQAMFTGLADAALTAGDVASAFAEEVKQDPNWFGKWIQLVEGGLKNTHTVLSGYGITSWAVSIAIFTAGVKFALFPLAYRQLESGQKMQLIAPMTEEIKKKARSKQQEQAMIAQMYEQTQVNPLAGCIPSLLQIPFFIGLYQSINALALEGALQEPFLFLPSLAGPTFGERGAGWLLGQWQNGVPPLGWQDTAAYLVLPALLVASQTASMKLLTPPVEEGAEKDPTTSSLQTVLNYFPLIIGWFSLNVPSGLAVYWLTNNFITTLSSLGVKQYLKVNPPKLDFGEFGDMMENTDPQTLSEAIEDAKVHAMPSRASRRMAMQMNMASSNEAFVTQ